MEGLAGNKRAIRKLAKQYDFFIAPPDLMPLLGRVIGPIFGPRGKMPEVVPPNVDVKTVVERLRRVVRVRLRNEPVIKVRVGAEGQKPEEILTNILAVLEELNRKFPLRQYLRDIYIKKTMVVNGRVFYSFLKAFPTALGGLALPIAPATISKVATYGIILVNSYRATPSVCSQ